MKNWIKKAIKKKGAFDRYCESHGFKGASKDCIDYAIKHGKSKTKKRAVLAYTLEKMSKKRRKK